MNKVKVAFGIAALAGLFLWWIIWGLTEFLRNLHAIMG
jgi:hypothetical protein